MNRVWVMGMAGWMVCAAAGCGRGPWAAIPPPGPEAGPEGGFELGRTETTVGEFIGFLNAAGAAEFPETAQIARRPGGGYAAKAGAARQAVADVTAAEAEAYCAWRARREGRTVRLPTAAEWEWAARGGVDGAPFPWGWGGNPVERARFDAAGPADRVGAYPANGFGLVDMAGNLYEWCAAEPAGPKERRLACGGSWAERDPRRLEVTHRQDFPADYRGRDVGFRTWRETKEKAK